MFPTQSSSGRKMLGHITGFLFKLYTFFCCHSNSIITLNDCVSSNVAVFLAVDGDIVRVGVGLGLGT